MMVNDWDEAVGVLRAVVTRVEGELPATDIDNVWEFIDVGELGLALDTLCTQLDECEVSLDAAALSSLVAVGRHIGLEEHVQETLGEGS